MWRTYSTERTFWLMLGTVFVLYFALVGDYLRRNPNRCIPFPRTFSTTFHDLQKTRSLPNVSIQYEPQQEVAGEENPTYPEISEFLKQEYAEHCMKTCYTNTMYNVLDT